MQQTALIVGDPKEAMVQLWKLHRTRIHLGTNVELRDLMEALADFVWPLERPEGSDSILRVDDPVTKMLVENGLFELVADVTAKGMFEEGLVSMLSSVCHQRQISYGTPRTTYPRFSP